MSMPQVRTATSKMGRAIQALLTPGKIYTPKEAYELFQKKA